MACRPLYIEIAPIGQLFTQHPHATHSSVSKAAFFLFAIKTTFKILVISYAILIGFCQVSFLWAVLSSETSISLQKHRSLLTKVRNMWILQSQRVSANKIDLLASAVREHAYKGLYRIQTGKTEADCCHKKDKSRLDEIKENLARIKLPKMPSSRKKRGIYICVNPSLVCHNDKVNQKKPRAA